MKTPDEFIREAHEPKFNYSTNEVVKLMEDYAAYMLEHSYSLKKMETERLRETRLNPGLHPTMKGAPAFWPYTPKDTAEPGIIGKNEEESE